MILVIIVLMYYVLVMIIYIYIYMEKIFCNDIDIIQNIDYF